MSGWSESEFREYCKSQIMFEPCEERVQAFIERIAKNMGLSQYTLYDILKGRVDLTPDRLPVLINAIRAATGSADIPRRLLTWLVCRCEGFALTETAGKAPDGSIEDDVEDLTVAAMDIFKEKVAALKDGVLDDRERGRLYLLAMNLRKELDELFGELRPSGDAR